MGATNHSLANRLTGSFQMLLMLMLPLLAFAQQSNNGGSLSNGTSINLTWERIVAGFVLTLVGFVLTFRGYRHFRFTLFLAGFLTGVVIVYSIFTNVSSNVNWNHRQVAYVFGCLAGGLIGGVITLIGGRFMFWILGGVAGLVIALYILAWRSGGLIHSKGGRAGLLAGASALGMIVGLCMGRAILIPASVIVGAYMTIVGIDLLARSGFSESISKFLTDNDASTYQLNSNIYIFLGCVGGLMILGLLYQTMAWKHRQAGLAAQGLSRHDYDNDWTPFGPKHHAVRPDPTYSSGQYEQTYSTDYGTRNHATGTGGDYSEKHTKWAPFKKGKTTATTTTAAAAPTTSGSNVAAPSTAAYNTTGSNAAYNTTGSNAAYNTTGSNDAAYNTTDSNAAAYNTTGSNAAAYNTTDSNAAAYNTTGSNAAAYNTTDSNAAAYNTTGSNTAYNTTAPNATAYNTATPTTDAAYNTATPTTDTAYTTDYHEENRDSYGSNAALNQSQQ